jgi:hypothetical protein
MQNKPNLLDTQINLSSVKKKDYENVHLLDHRKNKPNSNPIKTQLKPIKGKEVIVKEALSHE